MGRIERVNDDIQMALSSLLREVKDPRVGGRMISVTRVETAGDLSAAKVYLSILGDVDSREFSKGLKSASGWLRRELASSLNLRNTPELSFIIDHSIEHGAHIGKLLHGLQDGKPDSAENCDEA